MVNIKKKPFLKPWVASFSQAQESQWGRVSATVKLDILKFVFHRKPFFSKEAELMYNVVFSFHSKSCSLHFFLMKPWPFIDEEHCLIEPGSNMKFSQTLVSKSPLDYAMGTSERRHLQQLIFSMFPNTWLQFFISLTYKELGQFSLLILFCKRENAWGKRGWRRKHNMKSYGFDQVVE